LKEVNMRVDVTRQNEFADASNLFPERRRVLPAHRDALNLLAVDHYRRIRQHFAVSRINDSRADERNLLSVNRCGEEYEREYECNSKIHSKDSSQPSHKATARQATLLGMTKVILSILAQLSQQL
jgi:hypothetical protein